LKLAISDAIDDEACGDFDKPGGTVVASRSEEPESIIQNQDELADEVGVWKAVTRWGFILFHL